MVEFLQYTGRTSHLVIAFRIQRWRGAWPLDLTSSWNFNDPDGLLNAQYFQEKLKNLAQLFASRTIQTLIGVDASIATNAAPEFAVIGLSAMFTNWMAPIYQETPEVLRFLMGYIVSLTLVMDQLLMIVSMEPPRRVTREHLDLALESYKNSDAAMICQSNNAQEKVLELIEKHCAD
ncbi:hypothetical protein C8R44DRAFT_739479 [Mycena epipterygia]|nr:hypothetical protein C8R44DRAFT_739479 [Mycena epipterygia]